MSKVEMKKSGVTEECCCTKLKHTFPKVFLSNISRERQWGRHANMH